MLLERGSVQQRFVAACERADAETVRSILRDFPDIAASLPYQDQCVLGEAAWENEMEAVKVMLEAGFDPHVRCSDDSTPLHRAAFHGFSDVVKLLLQHDPLLADRNQYSARPLDMAVYGSTHSWRQDGDFPATVEALIQAGSEVDPSTVPCGDDDVDAVLRRYLDQDAGEE
jgi:ankyrin repeat protein